MFTPHSHNPAKKSNDYLNSSYSFAEAFIRGCSDNYREGYKAHQGVIDEQNARDKLNRDMIIGVIFAVAGGAAGGAVGVAVGNILGEVAKKTLTGGAITDAAKDLAKYLARMPPRYMGSTAANVSDTPIDPVIPTGATGGGASGAAAIDPFEWHNKALRQLATERGQAFRDLGDIRSASISAQEAGEVYDIDLDVLEVVKTSCWVAGRQLIDLQNEKIPTALEYERAFWETWLSQYAYTIWIPLLRPSRTGLISHDPEVLVVENVGHLLKEEIDRVAAKFQETGDAWIEKYGSPSQQKALTQAQQINRVD